MEEKILAIKAKQKPAVSTKEIQKTIVKLKKQSSNKCEKESNNLMLLMGKEKAYCLLNTVDEIFMECYNVITLEKAQKTKKKLT